MYLSIEHPPNPKLVWLRWYRVKLLRVQRLDGQDLDPSDLGIRDAAVPCRIGILDDLAVF